MNKRFASPAIFVLVTSLVPVLVVSLCWVVYFCRRFVATSALFRKFYNIREAEMLRARHLREHAHATLLITYLVFPSVSTAQFRGVDCHYFEGEFTLPTSSTPSTPKPHPRPPPHLTPSIPHNPPYACQQRVRNTTSVSILQFTAARRLFIQQITTECLLLTALSSPSTRSFKKRH